MVIGWTDPEDARPWLGALPLANYFAPRRNLVGLYASGKRAHGGMPEPVPGFEAPIKYRRDSSYRVAQLLKGSDLSQRGRVSRSPTLHEKRRHAATQTYMAIAPPST